MKATFNLVKEQWIPAVSQNMQLKYQSAEGALASAHQIKEINAATPIETISIYRFLLALLQAMFEINEESWKTMWAAGHFDKRIIDGYFEKWKHRFDLFDESHPFMQDPSLNSKPEPAGSLLGHFASGNDSTLFSHTTREHPEEFSPSEAITGLLSIHSFGVGGSKGKEFKFTDGYCARGIVFLITGRNLFETLMLNLPAPDMKHHYLIHRGDDRPFWEMDDPYFKSPRRPYGLVDHLTWPNRRVLLIPESRAEGGVIVREMKYGIGLSTSRKSGAREVFNPMYHWKANIKAAKEGKNDRGYSPLALSAEKSLWRSSDVILRLAKRDEKAEQKDKTIAALDWVRELIRQDFLAPQLSCTLSGYGALTTLGQDKTFFYRSEILPMPFELLDNENCFERLSENLMKAEETAKVVTYALKKLARWLVAPDKDLSKEENGRIGKLVESWSAEERYWAVLEPHFHRFITDLPNQPEQAAQAWQDEVIRAARTAFEYAEKCVSGDPRSYRAVAAAHPMFYRGLNKILPKQNANQTQVDE